jgi:Cu+-exporting ATPase
MSQRKSHIDIQGLSCANCSQTIADAVGSLDGVSEANINFATDEGSVEYDPDQVSLREIYDAIEDAGYSPVTDSETIAITDMSCANCSETVQDALERTPGVITADVNFATDEAQVTYNPAEASLTDFYDAIEDAGYSPVHEDSESEDGSGGDAREAARQEEIRRQLRLTLFGAALSTPLLFFLAEKFLLGGGVLPETILGIEFGWVEFLLATPVQLVLG